MNADEAEYIESFEKTTHFCLFAYCFNNAVVNVDNEGYYSTSSYKNMSYSGYIDNQKDPLWAKKAVGFWGNVGDNGCGAIAIYNLLYSYSKKTTLDKVLSNLRWKYGSMVYNNIGKIGISPSSVVLYLRTKFFFVFTATACTYWWRAKSELSGAVIILYATPKWKTLHYIAGVNGDTKFNFYNCNYVDFNKKTSIPTLLSTLKKKGCTPLYFIGVASKIGRW